MLKRKWRWIYMLLAVCLISIANPETVSAADAVGEKILEGYGYSYSAAEHGEMRGRKGAVR